MKLVEALEKFCRTIDRERVKEFFPHRIGTASGVELWGESMVAAVSLAGWLDDATSDEDLVAGVRHFAAIYDAGIVSDEDWLAEVEQVMRSVAMVSATMASRPRC